LVTALAAALLAAAVVPLVAAQATNRHHHGWGGHHHSSGAGKLLFFTSDGMRQDQIEKYADQGLLPGFRSMLRHGAFASGHGLLTQAPPNTGAGWFTLATGAWPGVHGSTNNTFHINGSNFATSQSAFPSGNASILQAETLAQSAERGGKKVAQIEWAGGRGGLIQGPTLDFRSFFSGRGVVTNYTSPTDIPANITAFGVQYDKQAPAPASGWSGAPNSFSPAMEMHMRVLDGTPAVDKYGLNAYIYDSTNDHKVNYDRVFFSRTKSAADKVADLKEGQLADVKVKIIGGALDGHTAAMLIKVERLASDLSQVRLFHTSVTRAIATWPTWPGSPGFTGSFEDFVAEKFPSSQAGDFAVLESGIVSEETYIDQQQYWETLYQPLIKYILDTYKPDLAMVGYPGTDEIQHQFLGLVTKKLPNGANNPAYDDIEVNGTPDHRVKQREAFIRDAYKGSDATMRLAQQHMHTSNLNTFVSSDHGFAPQFAAIDGSKPLVDLGLLSTPQTRNCALNTDSTRGTVETIGKAKACWAGGTLQVYLNLQNRDPVNAAFKQVAAADEASTVAAIKAKFESLQDPNDWTGDGNPENWKVIDRTFTKAQARFIPNGPHSTADMAHPTRTGDLVVFSFPPYQFDAETPGTLIARSQFFGQHGYVPDVQELKSNTNMRATFLAGGPAIKDGKVRGVRSIDLAPTAAYLLGVPAPQQSQGIVRRDALRHKPKALSVIGLNDFHGQISSTTRTYDNGIAAPVGGGAELASMFDEEAGRLPGRTLLLAGGDNVGASPPNSALLQDTPAIDVENAWGLDATAFGNHEFDFGIPRILQHEARANFPFLSANIVDAKTGDYPDFVKPSKVFRVGGERVGVIGATVQNTPELVAAGNTAGLSFLNEAERIKQESIRLRQRGVRIQIVVIHNGPNPGSNTIGLTPGVPWEGPINPIVDALQDTTIDLVIAGHTHNIANYVRGHIPIVEGVNAGGSYTVGQLLLRHGDVQWTGAATRISKDLGVPRRADVAEIVKKADDDTAPLRLAVVGRRSIDIKRDAPARLHESAMGNMVADAMLEKYPEAQAAITNSGGLRADMVSVPPAAPPADITYGEVFAVLPFGNGTVIETLTGAQFKQALVNGFKPPCGDTAGGTGRTPQVAGLRIRAHCVGTPPVKSAVIDSLEKVGPGGTLTPVGDTDTIRFVTNDFMYTGGDGYTAFAAGTSVKQTGDLLLNVVIDYLGKHSPVAPVTEDRWLVTP
jgi:2',3'-cyclic-nucleotide 2'-phosphodiesterase (5'-nucleotidase family)/predicted AlkP superfamily phosphohydrolase/phosphomutase